VEYHWIKIGKCEVKKRKIKIRKEAVYKSNEEQHEKEVRKMVLNKSNKLGFESRKDRLADLLNLSTKNDVKMFSNESLMNNRLGKLRNGLSAILDGKFISLTEIDNSRILLKDIIYNVGRTNEHKEKEYQVGQICKMRVGFVDSEVKKLVFDLEDTRCVSDNFKKEGKIGKMRSA
jgi:hypothetical protein